MFSGPKSIISELQWTCLPLEKQHLFLSKGKPLQQPTGCCEAIFFVTLRVTITSFLPFPFSCSINRKRGQRAASYQNNRSTFPINLWHLYSRWDGVGEAGRQPTKAHSIRPGSVHPDREREAGKYYNNKRPHPRILPTTTSLFTTPSPSRNRRNRHRTCRSTFCGLLSLTGAMAGR